MWRQIQRRNFTSWEKLAQFLNLDPSCFPSIVKKPTFPLSLPLRLAEKIEKNNLNDPILLQFVPLKQKNTDSTLFKKDPVGDVKAQKTSKLLKKYSDRALLLCTSSCAMHCRYCFRQHYEYETENKSFSEEITLIQNDLSLREIILSGGDPLSFRCRSKKPHQRS